jgi:hypothetical protein
MIQFLLLFVEFGHIISQFDLFYNILGPAFRALAILDLATILCSLRPMLTDTALEQRSTVLAKM